MKKPTSSERIGALESQLAQLRAALSEVTEQRNIALDRATGIAAGAAAARETAQTAKDEVSDG